MQKLYKTALQKIFIKIGAQRLESFTVSHLSQLLRQKQISLSEIDQNIFHKLPRQQLKNLLRNPCPINKQQQIKTELVTNAKAVRGALNIVEKKICFRCPYVDKCDNAFLQRLTDLQINNPLENLLISMKNIAQIENNNQTIKNRSWFSGVRVCDSLNSVIDDLIEGGEQFKTFKIQRAFLKEEADEKQKSQRQKQKQILKKAKNDRVPLKEIYAKIPKSKEQQQEVEEQGNIGLIKGQKEPNNIFKKKGDQFIKIAQKYLNEQKGSEKEIRKTVKKQKQGVKQKKITQSQKFKNRKPQKRQANKKNLDESQRRVSRNNEYQEKSMYISNKNSRSEERKYQKNHIGKVGTKQQNIEKNYQRGYQTNNSIPTNQFNRKQKLQNENYRRDHLNPNDQERQNPKIRRLSKDKAPQNLNHKINYAIQNQSSNKNNLKLDKFYSKIREEKTEEEQILSQLNKKESKPREKKLPRDAKYTNQEHHQKETASIKFSPEYIQRFDRLQKIPKILKSQFASNQDIQQRDQQQRQNSQETVERKGRRVRRQ